MKSTNTTECFRAWRWAERLLERCEGQVSFFAALLGLGLCRSCLGWALHLARQINPANSIVLTGHHAIDAGEILAFIIIGFLAYRRVPLHSVRYLFACSVGCMACGTVLMTLVVGGADLYPLFYFGGFISGVGYAALFLQWIELYGSLTPRTMAFAYACSYLINMALWFMLTNLPLAVGAGGAVLCAFGSGLALVAADRKLSASGRSLLLAQPKSISWRMILWLSVFAFTYGLGDSITGIGYATMISKLGMAIPAVVVVVGILTSRVFDLGSVYKISFLFMVIGFPLASFTESGGVVAPLLMSAANESYCMLAAIVACSVAYRLGGTSALYVGLISASYIFMTQAGEMAGTCLSSTSHGMGINIAILCFMVFACLFIFRERYVSEKVQLEQVEKTLNEEDLLSLARDKGLTTREQTVFLDLLRGLTTNSISERLFISQSAVRSHIGGIYRKFGVHSRQEFDEAIKNRL